MKTVGIIDAELLANNGSRFPNLAAMKLSYWHKGRGDLVTLVPDFKYVADFDLVYICCVFTEVARQIPPAVRQMKNVRCGGTGFFFDKSPPLPQAVEHSPPDYDLYQDWVPGKEGRKSPLLHGLLRGVLDTGLLPSLCLLCEPEYPEGSTGLAATRVLESEAEEGLPSGRQFLGLP